MILGIYKNLQIQEVGKLWIVEYKNPFHDHHGSGCEGEHFRCFGGIVEGVLLTNDRSTSLDDADILGILLKIDAVRGVEVGNPLLVHGLKVPRFVIVVLGDHTEFLGREAAQEMFQKQGFSRGRSPGDSDDKGLGHGGQINIFLCASQNFPARRKFKRAFTAFPRWEISFFSSNESMAKVRTCPWGWKMGS